MKNKEPKEPFSLPKPGFIIGDQCIYNGNGGNFEHRFPGNGEIQCQIPIAGAIEVEKAILAADTAFSDWKKIAASKRRDLLFKLADLVTENSEEFAWIGAREVGSPISGVRMIPQKFEAWTKYAAGWADKLEGRVVSNPRDDSVLDYTLLEPYGVIGMILTWNGPLMALAMKLGPALAAGNTVVIKPPESTPFTAFRLMQLVQQAGFPPGVINLVTGGAEAGQALVKHPLVKKIAFTGGTQIAKNIATSIAPLLKPAIWELGGKSANLIFSDADMQSAVRYSARQPLFLAGQGCILPTRLLVEKNIEAEFTERLIAEVASLQIGDPMEYETELGPVISKSAQSRIFDMISKSKELGDGTLSFGGGLPKDVDPNGYFVEPTIFTNVKPNSLIAQKECFGPVIVLMPFKTEDEAIEIANSTAFGLGAYIQSSDISRCNRLIEKLHAGGIFINGAPTARENAPFGGLEFSGFGREGGRDGMLEYTRVKNIGINTSRQ